MWVDSYNNERTHQGKMCCGRTPIDTFLDGLRFARDKDLAQMRSLPEPGTESEQVQLLGEDQRSGGVTPDANDSERCAGFGIRSQEIVAGGGARG